MSVVNYLRTLTGDKTITFDNAYDASGRPLFVSEKNEDIEYTIDEDNNIWEHDGFTDKIIGKKVVE